MTTLRHYTKEFRHYLRNTKAVSAIEYAILTGVVVAGIGAGVATFVEDMDLLLDNIGESLGTVDITAPTVTDLGPDTAD